MKTINGKEIKMTRVQIQELERDGMVVVGTRIIRTAAYVKRLEENAAKTISEVAKKVF